MGENQVASECGNCAFYLKPECPREFSADTHTYRGLTACEIFRPMTDEEKRMFDPIVLRKPPRPRCPQCNRVLEESWKACPYCGRNLMQPQPIEGLHVCTNCSRDFIGRRCPYCGSEVSESTKSLEQSSTPYRLYAKKPTALWYLLPLFFGLLGGIIAYVGIKGEDTEMADTLLFFGILWSAVLFVLWYFFIWLH